MGSTTSMISDSPANVIHSIEVVHHKDEMVQVYRILQIIIGLLIISLLLQGLRAYRKMIQEHKDRCHELEKVVTLANTLSSGHM